MLIEIPRGEILYMHRTSPKTWLPRGFSCGSYVRRSHAQMHTLSFNFTCRAVTDAILKHSSQGVFPAEAMLRCASTIHARADMRIEIPREEILSIYKTNTQNIASKRFFSRQQCSDNNHTKPSCHTKKLRCMAANGGQTRRWTQWKV